MIRAEIVDSLSDPARVSTVAFHQPDGRSFSRCGSTEDDLFSIRGLAGAKVPDAIPFGSQFDDRAIQRVQSTDLGSAACAVRFKVAVEVIQIRLIDSIFPGDFRVDRPSRKQDLAVRRP